MRSSYIKYHILIEKNPALDLRSALRIHSKHPSLCFQRSRFQNISFVYGRACFVLHVASKGDKVRVTRSSLFRSRKYCCEHQLLLRSARAARGLGLPRLLPNRETTVFVEDSLPVRTLTFQWLCRWGRCILLVIKGMRVAILKNIICTVLQHCG